MGRMIDDLLSFSRMGRHELSLQKVAVGELVRDILRELQPDIVGRTIDWQIGDLPAVQGEPAMLRMALFNLIANALKFTRPREKARIEIGSLPNRSAETVIYVRDNGVGFDMAAIRNERKQGEKQAALPSFLLNPIRKAALLIDHNARYRYANRVPCRIEGCRRDVFLTFMVYYKMVEMDWDFIYTGKTTPGFGLACMEGYPLLVGPVLFFSILCNRRWRWNI